MRAGDEADVQIQQIKQHRQVYIAKTTFRMGKPEIYHKILLSLCDRAHLLFHVVAFQDGHLGPLIGMLSRRHGLQSTALVKCPAVVGAHDAIMALHLAHPPAAKKYNLRIVPATPPTGKPLLGFIDAQEMNANCICIHI